MSLKGGMTWGIMTGGCMSEHLLRASDKNIVGVTSSGIAVNSVRDATSWLKQARSSLLTSR